MSSPSRPASVAAMTRSIWREERIFFTTSNWSRVSGRTISGQADGSMGSVSRRQRFHSASIWWGCASATRWPMAQVTT